jgi:hypothetical protein
MNLSLALQDAKRSLLLFQIHNLSDHTYQLSLNFDLGLQITSTMQKVYFSVKLTVCWGVALCLQREPEAEAPAQPLVV